MSILTKTNSFSLSELGLSQQFIGELVLKHFQTYGVLGQKQLIEYLGISWNVLFDILSYLKREELLESLNAFNSKELRYKLTDRGETVAKNLFAKNGYLGRAPVPLEQYKKTVEAQSIKNAVINKETLDKGFEKVVVSKKVLDRVGPALNSGKAVFIYGQSGTGKTFLTKRFASFLGGSVLIPHALLIDNLVVQVFDAAVHKVIQDSFVSDPRYVLCERPVIITGGELTLDMLEIQYDLYYKTYKAPLQLKANNGIYVIDDLGRQKARSEEILNRWIVPMEDKIDYLTFGNGQRFDVPFDVTLIFSTNLNPNDLADEAFIRRLGYKIKFEACKIQEYLAIWKSISETWEIPYNEELISDLVGSYYLERNAPLLPCHPRDLLSLILDTCNFQHIPPEVTKDTWNFAIENYFVSYED